MSDKEQAKIFASNLNYHIALANKSQKEICDALNISTSSMNNWCKGNSIPRMGTVQLLADYFHIGKSALIEDHSKLTEEAYMGMEDAMLTSQFHKLTPANREVLKSTLAALLAAQDM